ncbi:MAG: response regulator [Deltaproteobacteria bacterium]|nr:response regulator [Deltaproteobacteria bacterium]
MKRILVVDDSQFMRKRIIESLEAEGYQVVGDAKSGNAAIELYKQLRPDLVTMDITMREKDGLTATREILSFDPEARVIFLTILEDERYLEEAKRIGAKGFINKKDLKQLVEVVRKTMC